ncbi:hypothetical protein D623_10010021 [Myotis brandtii]|uniref:Uncharacterized protein n=1 Tax=Myotis brandtii TaxID=109478 RepID=S7MFC5_MYOBR|nr:hypothetical protein D623_10010021 [Myotis brandtii]
MITRVNGGREDAKDNPDASDCTGTSLPPGAGSRLHRDPGDNIRMCNSLQSHTRRDPVGTGEQQPVSPTSGTHQLTATRPKRKPSTALGLVCLQALAAGCTGTREITSECVTRSSHTQDGILSEQVSSSPCRPHPGLTS